MPQEPSAAPGKPRAAPAPGATEPHSGNRILYQANPTYSYASHASHAPHYDIAPAWDQLGWQSNPPPLTHGPGSWAPAPSNQDYVPALQPANQDWAQTTPRHETQYAVGPGNEPSRYRVTEPNRTPSTSMAPLNSWHAVAPQYPSAVQPPPHVRTDAIPTPVFHRQTGTAIGRVSPAQPMQQPTFQSQTPVAFPNVATARRSAIGNEGIADGVALNKKRKRPSTTEETKGHRTGATTSHSKKSTKATSGLFGAPRGTQSNPFELDASPEPQKSYATTTTPTQGTTIHLTGSTRQKPHETRWYGIQGGRAPGVYSDWTTVASTIKTHGGKQQRFPSRETAQAFVNAGPANITKPKDPLPIVGRQPATAHVQSTSLPDPYTAQTFETSAAISKQGPPPSSTPIAAVPATEPPLCKEQQDLVDLILSGRNVFYTGSAGCGKSTVLKAFVKKFSEMGKKVRIVAPTGRAALAINGTTTWSFVGWVPSHHKKPLDELLKGAWGKTVSERLTDTQVLVIDEISMVENLHFERINAFMKEARRSGLAFGGVQIIVTGDFCQLPPVKPFQHCIECGKDLVAVDVVIDNRKEKGYRCKDHGLYYDRDKWAFRSKAWKECKFTHVNLTNIHRQRDKVFIDILQKLRIGRPLSVPDVNLILNHETKGINANAVRLFGVRADCDRVNYERFTKLRSKPRSYKSVDDFRWNPQHRNLESKGRVDHNGALVELDRNEHRYNSEVHLKQGMAVVLLANLDIRAGLVNGAQGIIQGFKLPDPKTMPKALQVGKNGALIDNPTTSRALVGEYSMYREDQIQLFMDQSEIKQLPEVRFSNGERHVIWPDCTINEYGDSKPYTLMSRTQIPLTAGYAITTHKSQGMTLDKVEVNLDRSFEFGQVYVALSRARSLEGLKVTSFPEAARCTADPQVQEFLREHFPEAFVTEETSIDVG